LTHEEFVKKTQEIAQNLSDQAKVTTLLTELVTEHQTENASLEDFTKKVTQYEADNETLRQANMKLFLQVGAPPTVNNEPKTENQTSPENQPLEDPFQKLFNEQGGLK
jgi:hypothetical protein